MDILNIKGITKDFKGLRALNKVDIDVHEGEMLGLIGPNGSGKTTLVNVVTGFLKPTEGEVIYKGKPITGLKPHQITKRRIARTFQLTSLYSNLTVEENIVTGRYLKMSSSTLGSIFHTPGYREEEKGLRVKAREILTFMGLERQRDVLARNLPFGDERKLALAVALATDPELLILDEPATGMNPKEQEELVHLIQLIQEQMGITIIIIEHNMKLIMGVCRAIVVLDYGIKLAEGTPEEIAHNQDVISAYLGEYKLG